MPNKPRGFAPGEVYHLINRGNGRRKVFVERADYQFFVGLIGETKNKYGYRLHRAILIPNHYHLKAESPDEDSLSAAMWKIDKTYANYFNDKYETSGHLWQDRFKSYHVNSEAYDTACAIYIELNACRAGLVRDPADYEWSSCPAYLSDSGAFRGLIDADSTFMSVSESEEIRRVAHRTLLQDWIKRGMTKKEAKSHFKKLYRIG
jgi:putative transposase